MEKIKDEYTLLEKIGQGTYSVVYKGRKDSSGQLFAIKELRWSKQELVQLLPGYTREVQIMRTLHHRNIVSFFEEFEYNNRVHLVTDLCTYGDLVRFIKNKKLTTEEMLRIIGEMMEGLCYIHGQGYMHRDLKPENIFIAEEQVVKIGDYGMGKKFSIGMRNTQQIGTPLFAAPGILKGRGEYTPKCDVFSLGLIIYYIVFRNNLFRHAVDTEDLQDLQYKLLRSENRQRFLASLNCEDIFKQILDKCLTYEESKRPTIFELIDWFSRKSGLNYQNPFPLLFDNTEVDLCQTMLKYFKLVMEEIEQLTKKYLNIAEDINANKYKHLPTSDKYLLIYLLLGCYICDNVGLVTKFRDDYFKIGEKIVNWKLAVAGEFRTERNKFIDVYGQYYASFAPDFMQLSKNIVRCVKENSWGKDVLRVANTFIESRKMQGTNYYKKQIKQYIKTHYDLKTEPSKQSAQLKHWLKIAQE